ncbi:amidohydrolase [Isosphaera pallida ATCC 43644]|uniref:Amidohydrolase n=1 Tax=Isosphaera pallida (strain ATCC 43644 / DSM 9630 / IS1B) TaxID=575540 RepID=E8R6E5_ISOPI|nr:amidohydrolase family protein [Isosphaera pallida]ADV61846.1 amidohydrolase [Isosphaera pallida ATCC 43644]
MTATPTMTMHTALTDLAMSGLENRVTRVRWGIAAIVVAAVLGGSGPIAQAQSSGSIAFTGGRVIPVMGDPIDNAALVIREGRIAALGPVDQVTIPVEARVIDATGKTLIPGLIEVHTTSGQDAVNEINPNVPFLSVLDGINPGLPFFEDALRNGVTAAAIFPGDNTLIGGQGAVVKTAGTYVNDMTIVRNAGLKISLRPASGRGRMAQLARLRFELTKAREQIENDEKERKSQAEKEEANKGAEADKQDETNKEETKKQETSQDAASPSSGEDTANSADEQRAALVSLLKKQVPAFVSCDQAMDVPVALALANEFGFEPILVLGRDCYKAAQLIGKSKTPAILPPDLIFWETDPRTGEDLKRVLPEIFLDAGVPLLFQTSSTSSATLGSNFLWYQAALATRSGLTDAQALAAITLEPAKLLKIDNFVGSLEVGKDGDVVMLSGDPLKVGTWVELTVVNGRVVYDRSNDDKLKRLLEPVKETK